MVEPELEGALPDSELDDDEGDIEGDIEGEGDGDDDWESGRELSYSYVA